MFLDTRLGNQPRRSEDEKSFWRPASNRGDSCWNYRRILQSAVTRWRHWLRHSVIHLQRNFKSIKAATEAASPLYDAYERAKREYSSPRTSCIGVQYKKEVKAFINNFDPTVPADAGIIEHKCIGQPELNNDKEVLEGFGDVGDVGEVLIEPTIDPDIDAAWINQAWLNQVNTMEETQFDSFLHEPQAQPNQDTELGGDFNDSGTPFESSVLQSTMVTDIVQHTLHYRPHGIKSASEIRQMRCPRPTVADGLFERITSET